MLPPTLSPLELATFAALGIAIIGLWVNRSVWMGALLVAVLLGYISQVLYGPAIISIAALFIVCRYYSNARGYQKLLLALAIAAISIALGFHVLPGFHSPKAIAAAMLSPGAAPFDLYLYFDKTVPGILIIGSAYYGLIRTRHALVEATKIAMPLLLANIAVVTIAALALGYIRFAPHWSSLFWLWAFSNLFLTCLSEEAFFRGFIQRGISTALNTKRHGPVISLIISSILFGLAHFGGGWMYVLLATVAGFGYGYIFQQSKRLEMAILAHFALNVCHFLLFTYPHVG